MRFTKDQYHAAIGALTAGMTQLEPDGECCHICGDSGHQAWECGHNPLFAMQWCTKISKASEELHTMLHHLAGFDTFMGQQIGPARVHLPDAKSASVKIPGEPAKSEVAEVTHESAPDMFDGKPVNLDTITLDWPKRAVFIGGSDDPVCKLEQMLFDLQSSLRRGLCSRADAEAELNRYRLALKEHAQQDAATSPKVPGTLRHSVPGEYVVHDGLPVNPDGNAPRRQTTGHADNVPRSEA